PFFPPHDGCVLLIEDVGEAPYRVDRMLTSLRSSGVLSRVAGVLIGEFTACKPPDDGRTTDEGPRHRPRDLPSPIVGSTRIGHADESWEVALGGLVDLDADRRAVTFLQGAVAPP